MNLIDKKVEALEAFIEMKDQLKLGAPLRYLYWESTLRCNMQCLHCGSDCVRDDSTYDAEIGSDVIKSELLSIAGHYPPDKITLAIIGGEPLVRNDIIDVGAYAADLGYNWGITTNGLLLNAKMIKRLKNANLKTISVSLDGIEADHEALRNRTGSHTVVTRAIRRLLDDRFFVAFDIICCVSKININHLEEFMQEVTDLGIPAVRFTPLFSRGRAGSHSDLMLDSDDYLAMLNFIAHQRASQTAVKVNLSEEGYWGPEWEWLVRDDFHYCGSGIVMGSILHDGRVTGCPSVSRKYIEGNIRETPFVDIWQNRFTRYRQDKKRSFSKKCTACDHWDLCEGGGFHLLDPSDERSTFCSLEKINRKGVCSE